MGGVDDVVVAQQGVCAVEFRDDVFRGDFAGGVGDGEGRLGGERDGFEITFRGGGFQGRVRSGAGRGEETLEGGVGDPALDGDAAFVFVGADEIEAFGAPAAAEDGERIAGRSGFVNDEARGGAFGGGDFVFVGPATVVGHRVALEDGGIEFAGGGIDHGRVVDEHEDGLAADIEALVVVPAILRCDNAVADEDDVGVLDFDLRFQTAGGRGVFGDRRERDFAATGCEGGFSF